MSAEKFVEVQHQMRQNQTELSDYLKDLQGWEDEIKEKDRKLKSHSTVESSNTSLPPVRNSLEKKKRRKKKKDKSEDEKEGQKQRISSYDYRSWDKFDVDKACEDVDDKNSPESDSECETDEEWELIRQKQKAIAYKDQGNQYFKEGRYDEAVECYTRGIDCDQTNSVLSANRAMALLKQEKFGAAELDCTASISVDPTYIKAYHRRGAARIGLKKYKEALNDFDRVLKLEPGNKLAKKELEKIDKLLNPPPFSQTTGGEAGIVKPIYKALEKRSKKPLRRLTIEEIGEDDKEEKRKALVQKTQAAQGVVKKQIEAEDFAMFEEKFLSPAAVPCAGAKNTSPGVMPEADMGPLGQAVTSKSEDTETSVSDSVAADAHPVASLGQNAGHQGELRVDLRIVDEKSEVKGSSEKADREDSKRSPRVPPPPNSSYQFQSDWKLLRDTTEEFYHYLKEIEPSSYPKLFGQALDADVLLKILTTLKEFYIPRKCDPMPVLQALPRVKRFSMTLMFMSSKEKEVVTDLMQYLSFTNTLMPSILDELRQQYQV